MRTTLLALFSLVLFSCGTNKVFYQSADFSTKTSSHKLIAVLPVKMVQTGHVPKNVTAADLAAANEKLGFVFQETLLTFILKQTGKNKEGQLVSFQATQKTNALLVEQGWSIDEIYSKQPEALAKLLGVDAVIMTQVNHNKNLSDGLAYGLEAAGVLVNAVSRNRVITPTLNAADVNMNCSLYDAPDSKLLWKTYREGDSRLPGNTNDLIETYSNWIAKKLPYRS